MSDTTWTAGERPDGSAYLTTGDYVPGKAHCAFDVGCDFEMAQKIALALNSQERIAQLEAQLSEVRAILYAYEGTKAGNCITSDPYWLILRNGCLRGDNSVLAGPFFSKDEAEAHRRARIYAYGEKSYCYALSAHNARQFRRLREIVKGVKG